MKILDSGAPEARSGRYSTKLLHDEPNLRVIAFNLAEGQSVPPHSSGSTVLVHVTDGAGIFRGESEEATLEAGRSAVYAPGETHSMDALEGGLRFLAIIAPRPGVVSR